MSTVYVVCHSVDQEQQAPRFVCETAADADAVVGIMIAADDWAWVEAVEVTAPGDLVIADTWAAHARFNLLDALGRPLPINERIRPALRKRVRRNDEPRWLMQVNYDRRDTPFRGRSVYVQDAPSEDAARLAVLAGIAELVAETDQ